MSQQEDSTTEGPMDDGSPPGTAVDFIFRTMIARAGAPGKRQIRPKNVEELLSSDIQELGSDEDPDFDVSKDKHNNESDVSIGSDDDEDPNNSDDDKGSMDGNVEDSDEDDISYDAEKDPHLNSDDEIDSDDGDNGDSDNSDGSSDEDDKQSPLQKRSALRETLQKLNAEDYAPHLSRKRKRPRKAGTATSKAKASGKKDDNSSTAGSASKLKTKAKPRRKTAADKDRSAGRSGRKRSRDDDVTKKKKVKDKKKNTGVDNKEGILNKVSGLEQTIKENRKELDLGRPVCSACLGRFSDSFNEIVECDSCGITVHEACYGVSDTLSVSSGTGSSCSTEPWFCDACRVGANNICCELCPIQGGLYKETTSGRWVHLICALYTPGVVITDSGLPSLFDIPYAKWGAHVCSVCDDARFARAGICVPCDAGMCRAYLHVTCAQKHGLLSDPIPPSGEVEPDPFYAACKLHTNREVSKRKSRCYAQLQEQLRIKREKKLSTNLSQEEHLSQLRIRRKLERIRFKVAIKHACSNPASTANASTATKGLDKALVPLTAKNVNTAASTFPGSEIVPLGWTGSSKKMRLLPTSAGTAISFIRKASLMGLDIEGLELEDKHSRIVEGVRKKWNIQAGLSVEYAAYYGDRESRVTNLTKQFGKLHNENQKLNVQQVELQTSYNRECVHIDLMEEDNEDLQDKLLSLTGAVKSLCPPTNKNLWMSLRRMEEEAGMESQRHRNPSYSVGRPPSPSKAAGKKVKKSQSMSPIRRTSAERLAFKVCSVCDKSDGQPWIIRCDHCKKLYHLKCLDPPLTRLPKRSKQCGWMCSDCGEEELESDDTEVDTEAPRSLRGRTKIRKPGKYRNSTDSREGDLRIVCDAEEPSAATKRAADSGVQNPSVVIQRLQLPKLTNGEVKPKKPRKKKSISFDTSKNVAIPASIEASLASFDTSLVSTNPTNPVKPKRRYVRKKKVVQPQPGNETGTTSLGDMALVTDGTPKTPRRKPSVKKIKSESGVVASSDPVGVDSLSAIDKSMQVPSTQAGENLNSAESVPGKKTKKIKTERDSPNKVQKRPRKKSMPIPAPHASLDVLPGNPPDVLSATSKKRKSKKSGDQIPAETSQTDNKDSVLTSPEGTLKKRPKKRKISSDNHVGTPIPSADLNTSTGPSSQKKPRKYKKKVQDLAAAAGDDRTNVVAKKRPKKARKSAELREKKLKISESMLQAAATAVAVINDGGASSQPLPNGSAKPKRPYKRKKKPAASVDNLASEPSGESAKKKSKIVAPGSQEILTHEYDVINAVASGSFDGSPACKDGHACPPAADGVLMQGVAGGWTKDNKEIEDNSIMKGHAMGSQGSSGDVVTMLASDLLDAPTTTTTTKVTNYSPGFYSSTTTVHSGGGTATSQNAMACPKFSPGVDVEKNQNGPTTWDHNDKASTVHGHEAQNVIKLIYESSDAPTTVTVPADSVGVYAPPPPVVPNYNSVSNPPERCGKCFKCTKEDFKRNMVTCDKCAQDYHFMCLTPPLQYSPRRRNYAWYCSTCDEVDGGSHGQQKELETRQAELPQPVSPPQPQSSLTVHLYNDDMKNLMKNFSPK